MIEKKRIISLVLLLVFLFILSGFPVSAQKGFEVSSILLKVAVHQGDNVDKILNIKAFSEGKFDIKVNNVPGLSIRESNFFLDAGESRNVVVHFDSSSVSPGVYGGNIEVRKESEVFYVPLIFEVESKDVFFDVSIDVPPQYLEVEPGEKVVAQLKVVDLVGGGTSDGLNSGFVELQYYILGIDGRNVSSEAENLAIQRQVQFTKTIPFPKDMKEGNYILGVSVKYKSSVGTSSVLFTIAKKEKSYFRGDSGNTFIIIIGATVLIFIILFLFFVYLVNTGRKMIVELQKYNSSELKRQRELLLAQQRILRKKSMPEHKIKKEIERKIKKLKKKHEQRVKYFKKLNKAGKTKEMEKKLREWKKGGYNTLLLESKVNSLSTRDMQSLINKWKKRYT